MNSSGSGLPNFKDCTQTCISNMLANSEAQEPNRDSVDIALVTGSFIPSGSEHIGTFSRGMTASPAYIEKYGMPKHPVRTHQSSCTSLQRRHGRKAAICAQRARVGTADVQCNRFFKARFMPSIKWRIAGMGIALTTPDYLCRRDIEAGRLVRVLPDWPIPDRFGPRCRGSGSLPVSLRDGNSQCIKHGWRSHPDLKS